MKGEKMPFFRLIVFTAVLAAVFFLLDYFESGLLHEHIWRFLAFFSIQGYMTSRIIFLGAERSNGYIIPYYFVAMSLRFFCSVFVAFLFLYLGVENRLAFALNFFMLYLCFLWFEISLLLTNLRQNYNKSN